MIKKYMYMLGILAITIMFFPVSIFAMHCPGPDKLVFTKTKAETGVDLLSPLFEQVPPYYSLYSYSIKLTPDVQAEWHDPELTQTAYAGEFDTLPLNASLNIYVSQNMPLYCWYYFPGLGNLYITSKERRYFSLFEKANNFSTQPKYDRHEDSIEYEAHCSATLATVEQCSW